MNVKTSEIFAYFSRTVLGELKKQCMPILQYKYFFIENTLYQILLLKLKKLLVLSLYYFTTWQNIRSGHTHFQQIFLRPLASGPGLRLSGHVMPCPCRHVMPPSAQWGKLWIYEDFVTITENRSKVNQKQNWNIKRRFILVLTFLTS